MSYITTLVLHDTDSLGPSVTLLQILPPDTGANPSGPISSNPTICQTSTVSSELSFSISVEILKVESPKMYPVLPDGSQSSSSTDLNFKSKFSAKASLTGIINTPANKTPKTRKRKFITILPYAKIPIKIIDDTQTHCNVSSAKNNTAS